MNPSPEIQGRSELRVMFDAAVGERITTLRKRGGMSQKELAVVLGIVEGTMSDKIAAGPWYGWELDILVSTLNTTLDVLYGREDMPPAPVSSIVGRKRKRKIVGRMGLEPMTDGLWVAPVIPLRPAAV